MGYVHDYPIYAERRTTYTLALAGVSTSDNTTFVDNIAIGSSTSYTYDALGRLTAVATVSGAANGVPSAYSFDSAGDRINVAVTDAANSVEVSDRSFEQPNVSGGGYAYKPSVTGTAFSGSSGVAANGSAWGFASASDGNQVGFTQLSNGKSGGIALAISGLLPGQTYQVQFRLAQRPSYGINPITGRFNGTSLGTLTPSLTSFATIVTGSFQASAAMGTLTFSSVRSIGDTATGIDAVQLSLAVSSQGIDYTR